MVDLTKKLQGYNLTQNTKYNKAHSALLLNSVSEFIVICYLSVRVKNQGCFPTMSHPQIRYASLKPTIDQ